MSTVREVTYEALRSLGMKIIFGNPASNELPFLKDMPPDFRYVLGLHERSAAGMALGYAMAKREAVFVNRTLSPAPVTDYPQSSTPTTATFR